MGLALAPDFAASGAFYVYYTYDVAGGVRNRVVRLRLSEGQATAEATVLDDLPGATVHDGGAIAFRPDGKLYVGTGDARRPALAPDRTSPGGKVLRLNPDGTVPDDNPFPGSPVYSLGHRNPQGLAWNPETGDLYATEHGASGNDELNLIEPGANYGWPLAEGAEHGEFAAPLAVYGLSIAPSGATWYESSAIPPWRADLLFATLAGTHLHRVSVDSDDPRRVTGQEEVFDERYGRLRDVRAGPDGELYLLTSNRDGRGSPTEDDDRLLRISWSNG